MTSALSITPRTSVQVASYRPGATYGPRLLVDHELVWILSGSAWWTVRQPATPLSGDENRCLLTPGMIALACSGTIDSYQWDPSVTSSHAYVHFRVDDPGPLPSTSDWPAVRVLRTGSILDGICGYLLELAGESSAAARARSDELVALLLDLVVSGPLPEPRPPGPPWLNTLTEHVRRAWAADGIRSVEVAELARAAAVSEGHLHRLFRQNYTCGPARAFELVRLASAATGLQRSNATLAQLAQQSGFANPYHFSRRFTATYGLPPGAYRRLPVPPDPLGPVRAAGLLPVAHRLLASADR